MLVVGSVNSEYCPRVGVMTWSAHNQVTTSSLTSHQPLCVTRISSLSGHARPPGRDTVFTFYSAMMEGCSLFTLNWLPQYPLLGDNIMLFIFARQVRDMRPRPEHCDDGGDNKWAKLGPTMAENVSQLSRPLWNTKSEIYNKIPRPDTEWGDVIKFAYNLFPMSPCY